MKYIFDALKSDAFKRFGIVGGALTIIGNMQSLLLLSKWAHQLLDNWSAWIKSIWSYILSLEINNLDASLLTMNLFFCSKYNELS